MRPARVPRSHLLAVVSIVCLLLVLLLGLALATLASAHVSAATISASASADRALAINLLDELGPLAVTEPSTVADRARMHAVLEEAVEAVGLLGIAVVGPDGHPWTSAGPEGASPALRGRVSGNEPTAVLADDGERSRLVEWFPVSRDEGVVSSLAIVRDGTSVVAAAAAAQRDIAIAAGFGASTVIAAVVLIFRRAQRRLDQQTAQLVEASRRDPLTGVLTHGASVSSLTAALATGSDPVSMALVDIDGFRQLNELHGHGLGDAVIRRVASALEARPLPATAIGRSGPDEFLVVCPGIDATALAAWLNEIRHEIGRTGIESASGAELPLGYSAGIAVAPLHGRTATELLSAAGLTLGEAKSGGGNRVVVSRLSYADLLVEHRTSFSILDGLVNAIDARDRYTRYHSDDVARYALFLARQLGVDDASAQALHDAALLHDVGKIAVPDAILRKPAGLSEAEMSVMKQHVLLGAVLVRDLAAADLVSDGVRHHHERWDGTGYPDALVEEEIPLIARIIAVADAFSAMTTTRPYRRALSRQTALGRLTAAAGTQLDPRLVDVFVLAMESQEMAPLPSDSRAPAAWLAEGAA